MRAARLPSTSILFTVAISASLACSSSPPPSCEATVGHIAALRGSLDVRANIAKCHREEWTGDARRCVIRASSTKDVTGCMSGRANPDPRPAALAPRGPAGAAAGGDPAVAGAPAASIVAGGGPYFPGSDPPEAAPPPSVGLGIEARMYLRTGENGPEIFAEGDYPMITTRDWGDFADEVLVVATVPYTAVNEALSLTVVQGSTTTTRSWTVHWSPFVEYDIGHYPVLVPTDECNPMSITARLGRETMSRTIDFSCME